MSEGLSVALLLTSLSDDYESLVTGFQAWDEKLLTMKAVGGTLNDAYNRKQATVKDSSNSSSIVANKKFQPNYKPNSSSSSQSYHRPGDDRQSTFDRNRHSRSSHQTMEDRLIFFCSKSGKRGHHGEDCRKLQFNKPLNRGNQTHNNAPPHARPAQDERHCTY